MWATVFADNSESRKINILHQILAQRACEFFKKMNHSCFGVKEVVPGNEEGKIRISIRVDVGGEFGFLKAEHNLRAFLIYNDLMNKKIVMTRIKANTAVFDVNVSLNELANKIIKRFTESQTGLSKDGSYEDAPSEFDSPCEYIKYALSQQTKFPTQGSLEIEKQAAELIVRPRPGSGWPMDMNKYLAQDFAQQFSLTIRHGGYPETRDGNIYISGSIETILSQLSHQKDKVETLSYLKVNQVLGSKGDIN
jgi:hypothetical protein